MSHQKATAYLQIEPKWKSWFTTRDENALAGARVVRVTQKYPESTVPGCVVVKINLNVPSGAFLPLEPEATITIPEHLVQHPVEVEAG